MRKDDDEDADDAISYHDNADEGMNMIDDATLIMVMMMVLH